MHSGIRSIMFSEVSSGQYCIAVLSGRQQAVRLSGSEAEAE